jgi:hypothetical protein
MEDEMRNSKFFLVGIIMVLGFLFLACQNENPISTTENESLLKLRPLTGTTCQFYLSPEEEEGLIHMRLEEKVARDVYIYFYTLYNKKIFSTIMESEQGHMDAIKTLLNNYSVEDPVIDDTPGVFPTGSVFQDLYNGYILQGQTLEGAYLAGKDIEELDIADLNYQLDYVVSGNPDIENVYTNLKAASQNHLSAFNNHINTDIF